MVIETSTSSPIQSRRKAVHSLVDHRLRFATNHEVLSQWLNSGPIIGRSLTELFPEIEGFEEAIHELPQINVLVFPAIRRLMSDTQEIYFDLQLEPALHLDDMFSLTLIDVTEQVHIREYEQQPTGLHQQFRSQQNGYRVAELERHNRNLHLLNQASHTLITTLEKQAVLDQLLRVATELIHVEGSSIWLWDEETAGEMICRAVYNIEEEPALLNQRLKRGQGVGGTAVETKQIVVVPDTHQDDRFYAGIDQRTGVTTTSIMAVPLQFHDISLGVLELVNKAEGAAFTVEDQTMAETLATFASVAIYNAQLVGSLQESNEELDSFAHTVAHDLQNTLSIVIGFAELLRRDDARLAEDRRKQMAEALVKNTYKMSNIIKELLLLSSVRKSEVTIEPLNMQQIVEAALLRLSYVLEDYNPEIVIQERWPVAIGHAAWIEEIWENYISNALKYGGQPPRVAVGGEKLPDGRVRFWVRDNGPGLTTEEQARLFDPFVQLSKVRVKGSGLGLSIVQRIASKLGGEVGVESEVGQGSVFTLTLPGVAEGRD